MKKPIEKRYEFVALIDVQFGNPNGDPDAGNQPRLDSTTMQGYITDVCIKRKIRNYVDITRGDVEGYSIYVTEGVPLNKQHRKAYDLLKLKPETKKLPKDAEKAAQLAKEMARMFYDIRAFGAVMTTEVNCGQLRGPVQLAFATSIDPITPFDVTLTRITVTREDEDKDHDMGNKQIIPYGLYRLEGYVSPFFAERTGFSEDDLELLWEALLNMFELDHSASRGKMDTQKLVVFEHSSKLGSAQSSKLFDLVKVEHTEGVSVPRKFDDYVVTVDEENAPIGVKVIVMR